MASKISDVLGVLPFTDTPVHKMVVMYGSLFAVSWFCYKAFLEPLLSPLRKVNDIKQ